MIKSIKRLFLRSKCLYKGHYWILRLPNFTQVPFELPREIINTNKFIACSRCGKVERDMEFKVIPVETDFIQLH